VTASASGADVCDASAHSLDSPLACVATAVPITALRLAEVLSILSAKSTEAAADAEAAAEAEDPKAFSFAPLDASGGSSPKSACSPSSSGSPSAPGSPRSPAAGGAPAAARARTRSRSVALPPPAPSLLAAAAALPVRPALPVAISMALPEELARRLRDEAEAAAEAAEEGAGAGAGAGAAGAPAKPSLLRRAWRRAGKFFKKNADAFARSALAAVAVGAAAALCILTGPFGGVMLLLGGLAVGAALATAYDVGQAHGLGRAGAGAGAGPAGEGEVESEYAAPIAGQAS